VDWPRVARALGRLPTSRSQTDENRVMSPHNDTNAMQINTEPDGFAIDIAAMFARQILEASVVVGLYAICASVKANVGQKKQTLKEMWGFAITALIVATATQVALVLPLYQRGDSISSIGAKAIELVQGGSKLIGAIFLLRLSVGLPLWLRLGQSQTNAAAGVTRTDAFFLIAWNLWRELCEAGNYISIPLLEGSNLPSAGATALSAVAGVAIGVAGGLVLYTSYYILARYKKFGLLAAWTALVSGWLASGMFVGAMLEFEQAIARSDVFATRLVAKMPNGTEDSGVDVDLFPTSTVFSLPSSWTPTAFPWALAVPFGYAQNPTIVAIASFWAFAFITVLAHLFAAKFLVHKCLCCKRATTAASKASQDDVSRNTGSPNDSISDEGAPAPAPAPANATMEGEPPELPAPEPKAARRVKWSPWKKSSSKARPKPSTSAPATAMTGEVTQLQEV
jgi:hypothetical protein